MQIMNKIILLIILASSFSHSEECRIDGNPVLWAYDMCFSMNETDDSIHPGVISCVESAQLKIKNLGECKAKEDFKALICEVGSYHNLTYKECIESAETVGPSIRNGGI